MMKQKIILPVLGTVLIGVGAFGATRALADDTITTSNVPSIIQRLADRFEVSTDDVKTVFEEARADHRQEMQARMSERLDQLVSDGKITADQKNLIEDKIAEIEAQRKSDKNQDLTPEQRRQQMEDERDSFEQWAKDNGIDSSYLMMFRGRGGHHGMMGGHMGMLGNDE
ncbi:hypothetical protein HGA91_05370 [candidate division WWE3 bacterium]|nr:hypothetical protein [candidate division WWE3 bacterium]